MFGVQFQRLYGTAGEFRIKSQRGEVVAKYIQTRMRPALDGQWDSILTNHMRPWREIFPVERMSFDELLQRELDDSRVANDLIPYLMGAESSKYPVFPPILAVLTPKAAGSTEGIQRYYPAPEKSDAGVVKFGDVFEVGNYKINGEQSPIDELRYNEHRSAFVIVDGQHRAMAVLALFRQLRGSSAWGSNPYATYYSHLRPNPEQVSHIELPVCVLYFPGVHEGSREAYDTDSDLTTICRQIFLDVNQTARKVSQSRQLLLEDSLFPSILTRKILSSLKNRDNLPELARIHAIDYSRGDSSEQERIVVTAPTEYSSSHALHVCIASLCFANPDALSIRSSVDVIDGRHRRNSSRPVSLLANRTTRKVISANHAGRLRREESRQIASDLADLWMPILPGMFDRLRVYQVHNAELNALHMRLSTPQAQANSALNEARGLLFDGGGGRVVFLNHIERLQKYLDRDEAQEANVFGHFREKSVTIDNLEHCKAVQHALDDQVADFQRRRAYAFWRISSEKFAAGSTEDRQIITQARSVFDAFSTQAFQLGFVMACAYVIDVLLEEATSSTFEDHAQAIKFSTGAVAAALNAFFDDPTVEVRQSINKGLINRKYAHMFNPSDGIFRRIYSGEKGAELNEKAWRLFRYACIEMLMSDIGKEAVATLLSSEPSEAGALFDTKTSRLSEDLEAAREHWIGRYCELRARSPEYQRHIDKLHANLLAAGQDESSAKAQIEQTIEADTKAWQQEIKTELDSTIRHAKPKKKD